MNYDEQIVFDKSLQLLKQLEKLSREYTYKQKALLDRLNDTRTLCTHTKIVDQICVVCGRHEHL